VLLRSKPGTDEYTSHFSQAIQSGILGTRLGAGKVRQVVPKSFATPADVTSSAGPRADVTVLPNLLASVKLSKSDAALRPFTTPNPLKGGGPSSGGHGHGHGGGGGGDGRPLSQTMQLMKSGIPPGIGWPPGTTTLVIGGRGRK
jgi:hypothetical protein